MFATAFSKSSQEEREILYDPAKKDVFKIFLYQQFIHNVILGKPKNIAIQDYEEWYKKSKDEKRTLRLITFIKRLPFNF